ncbi:MAG TPA: hypothetical protein VEC14_01115 [Reyranellaceae bacterium]|nr:hypothetical protein [Reyranellaceae bacterium]
MNDPSCKTCRHGTPAQQGGGVECRRFPPQMLLLPAPPTLANPNQPQLAVSGLRPVMQPASWCGEFSPKVTQ